MIFKELLQGAINYVKWADISVGDKVLIISPWDVEPDFLQAIHLAVELSEASVYVLKTEKYNILSGPAPEYINAAAQGADVVLSIGGLEYGVGSGSFKGQKEFLARYGTSLIPTRAVTVRELSSEQARYPLELLYKLADRVNRFVLGGKTLRVTTPRGTDVTMGINPDYFGGNSIIPKKPGPFVGLGFPGVVLGIVPWNPYNGQIVVDAFFPPLNPPEIFLRDPVTIKVENWRATTITGPHAEWVANYLDRDKNGRWGAECMFGFHPHAYPDKNDTEIGWFRTLHDRASTLHLAFGNSIGGSGPYYSAVHFDVYTYHPDVYVDDRKLIDHGHLTLLEDKELREEAKPFGDPDDLLQERPIPPNVLRLINN